MYIDPSWDIMPVANPDLPESKRRRIVRDSLAKDPVGAAEPTPQVRHRRQIVAPFSLDRAGRQLPTGNAASPILHDHALVCI